MKKITVVIPTIPERADTLLLKAVRSVEEQYTPLKNLDVHIITDTEGLGPAVMRNVGVRHAKTPWVAFLDDDDEMLPHHLSALLKIAEKETADVVYPWFHWAVDGVVNDTLDPLRLRGKSPLGQPPDPIGLMGRNYIPVTTLVRKSAFEAAGGFPEPGEFEGPEDWGLWLRMVSIDARFVHLPDRTWIWNHHAGQTGGRPS